MTLPVSGVLAALEGGWTAIRLVHPEIPDSVVTLGPGSRSARSNSVTLGHFSTRARWVVARENHRPEVMITGEALAGEATRLLEVLLHEGAHGLAYARDLEETSQEGRYHNETYAQLAREVGLHVERSQWGWNETSVPSATAAAYRDVLGRLAAAQAAMRHAHRQVVEESATAGREAAAKRIFRFVVICRCEPPRRLPVTRKCFEEAPLLCGACQGPFEPEKGASS